MKRKLILLILIPFLILGCGKTIQQKVVKKWTGKWEINSVEGADFSKDNPYGIMEFFEDGTGELRIKNFDYSSEEMGLVIPFVLLPQSGSHLEIAGLRVSETAPGYENYLNEIPCDEGKISFLTNRGYVTLGKKATMDLAMYPNCFFESRIWKMKRTK